MPSWWSRFWAWYERHYALNVSIAALLFVLQVVHLVWLSLDVVAARALGDSLWDAGGALQWLILLVDYTEAPAILSVSLVYVNEIRKGAGAKPWILLALLNSQWLHIFWITDEFVVAEARGEDGSSLPGWLAWVAILIDYGELPVIADTLRRMSAALRAQAGSRALAALRR